MLKLVEIHFQRNKYSNLVPSLIVFGEALIIIENSAKTSFRFSPVSCRAPRLKFAHGFAHPLQRSERDREREGEREMSRIVIFLFKRNDGCLGTFWLSS